MTNTDKKEVIIEFREFGLANPTVIQFYINSDEFIRYEIKGASVEQICNKIKLIQRVFSCVCAKYVTSPYNLQSIKKRSLANVTKSVWELFNECGITIHQCQEKQK